MKVAQTSSLVVTLLSNLYKHPAHILDDSVVVEETC